MAEHASEAGHYYDRQGNPAYEQTARNGTQRPTTLRDARSQLLVPSVTMIIRCAAAPALENWKFEQGIMAALTLPRGAEESEACWLDRIRNDSREQARLAAERGTEIHAEIEEFYGKLAGIGGYWYTPLLIGVDNAITDRFGIRDWETERAFSHPLGFGGKADLLSGDVLIDFKTKDTVDDSTKGYDEHLMQLAAYRVGLRCEDARCANCFVSRSEPWTVRIHEWSEDDLQRGWEQFQCLLRFWQLKNHYDSAFEEEAPLASTL